MNNTEYLVERIKKLKENIEVNITIGFLMSFFALAMLVVGLTGKCLEAWIITGVLGGFLLGCTIVAFTFAIIDACKIKRIKESKKMVDEIQEKNKEYRTKIEMELMESSVYMNLRFRDLVLRDKFFGITNKKLQEDFLNESLGIWTNVADAIEQFKNYNFTYREEFDEMLDSYQRKQAILDEYAETKPKTKKQTMVNKVIPAQKTGVKKRRGRPRKNA